MAQEAQKNVDAWHQWAYGVLGGIGAPVTQTNLDTLWNWSLKESGQSVMRWNNPLNTTQTAPGSISQNSVGVQSYPDVSTGIAATTQTMLNGRYPDIITAFRNSVPTSQWGSNSAIVKELGVWGSGANWLSWTNVPPSSSNNFLASSQGGSSTSGSGGNPVSDAINAALGPVGTAITSAEQDFIKTATNIMLMVVGAGLMLGGLVLLTYGSLQRPLGKVAGAIGGASEATPQGRTVRTAARAATPAPAAPAKTPATSPQKLQGRLSEYGYSRDLETRQNGKPTGRLRPSVKSELRRVS